MTNLRLSVIASRSGLTAGGANDTRPVAGPGWMVAGNVDRLRMEVDLTKRAVAELEKAIAALTQTTGQLSPVWHQPYLTLLTRPLS